MARQKFLSRGTRQLDLGVLSGKYGETPTGSKGGKCR